MTTTTRSPVRLESLRIATPCSADWDDMKGDDLVRFCGRCEKNVYDLSALSRTEAEQLVADKEGRMCVRFFQRADGTVLTSDCPVGVRRERLRQRIWNRIAGAATSAALLVGLWSGRARADLTVGDGKTTTTTKAKPPVPMAGGLAHPKPQPEPHLMGKIAAPKPPEPPRPMMGAPMPQPQPKPEPKPQPKIGVSDDKVQMMGEPAAPQAKQGDIATPPKK